MKNIKFIKISLTLILVTNLSAYSSVKDYLSKEEKLLIEQYKNEDMQKDIEKTRIKQYICQKIEKAENSKEKENGFYIMRNLSPIHLKSFEDFLISYISNAIISDATNYPDRDSLEPVRVAINNLTIIYGDKGVKFLLSLIHESEKWPSSLKEGFIKNPKPDFFEKEIRNSAFGWLIDHDFGKGKVLNIEIKNVVTGLSEKDQLKEYLIRRIDFVEKVNKGELDIGNPSSY